MTSRVGGVGAQLFTPASGHARGGAPVAVVLTGQVVGQSAEAAAERLADDDVPAVAVDYFPRSGSQAGISSINSLDVVRAIGAELSSYDLHLAPLVLVAHSRGCELAFLVAPHLDGLMGIAASAPSAVANSAMRSVHMAFDEPAWLMDDSPVEHFRGRYRAREYVGLFVNGRLTQRGRFRGWAENTQWRLPTPAIGCPMLLQYGDDDRFWPADEFVAAIVHSAERPEAVCHRGCGHLGLFPSALPGDHPLTVVEETTGANVEFGGKSSANSAAASESYRRVLHFIRELDHRTSFGDHQSRPDFRTEPVEGLEH